MTTFITIIAVAFAVLFGGTCVVLSSIFLWKYVIIGLPSAFKHRNDIVGGHTPKIDTNYVRMDDASGNFIGWYDMNSGTAMNRTKTAVIAPYYGNSRDNRY